MRRDRKRRRGRISLLTVLCSVVMLMLPFVCSAEEAVEGSVHNVWVDIWTLDERGEDKAVVVFEAEVEDGATLRDSGLVFPEMTSRYSPLNQIGWTDDAGNPIDENEFLDRPVTEDIGCYIYAQYDQLMVYLRYDYVGSEGEDASVLEKRIMPKSVKYADIKAEAAKRTAPEDIYSGLGFQGWEITVDGYEEGQSPTGMTVTVISSAVYDRGYFRIGYVYPDQQKHYQYNSKVLFYEAGDTYDSLIKEAEQYRPADLYSTEGFSWETDLFEAESGEYLDRNSVIAGYGNITLGAKYSGKNILWIERYYYNEKGFLYTRDSEWMVQVAENASASDVLKEIQSWDDPVMFEGLRFTGWRIHDDDADITADTEIYNGKSIIVDAQYSNCMLRYKIDPWYGDMDNYPYPVYDEDHEAIIAQVVEKGTQVTVPDKLQGYDTVTFDDCKAGSSFIVNENKSLYGYGTKSSVTEPEPPLEEPSKELPKETVDQTVTAIEEAEEGQSVKVEMTDGATVLDTDILEAAKGQDVEVSLDMGDYVWTFSGKDIETVPVENIDMEVIVGTENIPETTVKALAGENPTEQITLLHEGDFGFTAVLTTNIGEEYSGMYGNLFYHDDEGKLTFISSGWIDANGDINLKFSHASDYVLVMSKEAMSENSIPESLRPVEQGGNTPSNPDTPEDPDTPSNPDTPENPDTPSNPNASGGESGKPSTPQTPSNQSASGSNTQSEGGETVQTGDTTQSLPYLLSLAFSLVLVICLNKKRKQDLI